MRRTILLAGLLLTAVSAFAREYTYVYTQGDHSRSVITRGSLENVLRVRRELSGTYIWVVRDRHEYVIRDPGILGEVKKAFGPLEAFSPQQEALRAKMHPVERRADAIEREMDRLYDRDEDDDALTAAEEDRLRQLERRFREIEVELRQYEREESRLDDIEERLEEEFEAKLDKLIDRAFDQGLAQRLR
jgi:DNA repair exonuclease SbcCD ATPase subunit